MRNLTQKKLIYFILVNPLNKTNNNSMSIQNTHITYDLSLIFNENGYINEKDCNKYMVNYCIKNVTLTQSIDSPIKIGDNFLSLHYVLFSVDTSQLINVVAIGNNFLYDCCMLTNFNASGLTNLKTIGHNFLSYCVNLIDFDASYLTSLIAVGSEFLCTCKSLTITVKNPSDYLRDQLTKTNCAIDQSCDKPCIYLDNACVI